MIALVEERGPRVGIAPLCGALGLARATFYRRRAGPARQPRVQRGFSHDHVFAMLLARLERTSASRTRRD